MNTAVRLSVIVAVQATACGSGGDAGSTASRSDPTREAAEPAEPFPQAITAEERRSADLVLITGETRADTEIAGYAFDGDRIVSPGPNIRLRAGNPVTIVLENVHGYVGGESISHDFAIVGERDESAEPLWGAHTETLGPGDADLITFTPDAPGSYFYICSL
ncbi:MAG TPA: hypothetical protein VE962_03270, partial [Actinomycetota bacterium]|nr:hypothetical protein [Actinomycetota bacterium]